MRHHWTTRLLAAFMAVWLPLCLTGAGLVPACPMHEMGRAEMSTMPMANMPAMTGMDRVVKGPAQPHGAQDQPAPSDGQQHCMCMGPCTTSAGLAPSPAISLPAQRIVAARPAPLAGDVAAPVAAPQVRLPFSVGPPVGVAL